MFIIKEGHLYKCDQNGNIGIRIQSNVVFADYDKSTDRYLVTKIDGTVCICDKNGNSFGSYWKDCCEARFNGTDVMVVYKNRKTVITDKNGNIKRILS